MAAVKESEQGTAVWDPISKELFRETNADKLDGYEQSGFSVGAEAEKLGREGSAFGQLAAFGAQLVPSFEKSRGARDYTRELEDVNPKSALAGRLAQGALVTTGAGLAALPLGAGAAAGARIATSGALSGAEAATEAHDAGAPITAEMMAHSIGLGALFGAAGEGIGYAAPKAIPWLKGAATRRLDKLAEAPWLKRVADPALGEAVTPLTERPTLDGGSPADYLTSKEALASRDFMDSFKGRAKPAMPEPLSAKLTEPEIPFARAEHVPAVESPEAWAQRRSDIRASNLSPEARAEIEASYQEQLANAHPDAREGLRAEIEAERGGLANQELPGFPQPEPSLGITDAVYNTAPELPRRATIEPEVIPAGEAPFPKSKYGPDYMPPPFKGQKLPPLPTLSKMGSIERSIAEGANGELPNPFGRAPGQYVRAQSDGLFNAGLKTYGLHHIPVVGRPLSYAFGGFKAAKYFAQEAGLAALNHERQMGMVLDHVLDPSTRAMGKVTSSLLKAGGPHLAAATPSKQVIPEAQAPAQYAQVTSAVNDLYANPDKIDAIIHEKFADILDAHPQLASNLKVQQLKSISYLYQQMPPVPDLDRGLLDTYTQQPPRSVQRDFLEKVKGVNDPFGAIAEPTPAGIEAVEATSPAILQKVRDHIATTLVNDPRMGEKLSREQIRSLSIVLGKPLKFAVAPSYITYVQDLAHKQAAAQDPSAAPSQSPAQVAGAQGGRPPNTPPGRLRTNGLTSNIATSAGTPGEQRAIENAG